MGWKAEIDLKKGLKQTVNDFEKSKQLRGIT